MVESSLLFKKKNPTSVLDSKWMRTRKVAMYQTRHLHFIVAMTYWIINYQSWLDVCVSENGSWWHSLKKGGWLARPKTWMDSRACGFWWIQSSLGSGVTAHWEALQGVTKPLLVVDILIVSLVFWLLGKPVVGYLSSLLFLIGITVYMKPRIVLRL